MVVRRNCPARGGAISVVEWICKPNSVKRAGLHPPRRGVYSPRRSDGHLSGIAIARNLVRSNFSNPSADKICRGNADLAPGRVFLRSPSLESAVGSYSTLFTLTRLSFAAQSLGWRYMSLWHFPWASFDPAGARIPRMLTNVAYAAIRDARHVERNYSRSPLATACFPTAAPQRKLQAPNPKRFGICVL